MSAQALLSMIAPAVPSAPQGSSGEAASGFQGLLATLMSAAGAPTETSAGATPADLSIAPDKTNEAVVAAGFLIVPPTPSAPPAVAPATGVSAEADGAQIELAPAAPAAPTASSMSTAAAAAAPLASTGSTNSDTPTAAERAPVETGEVPAAGPDGIAPAKAGAPDDTASTPVLQSTKPPVTPQSVTNGEPASRAAEAQPLRPAPEPARQTPAATLAPPVQAGAPEAVEAAQAQAQTRAAPPPTPLPPTPPVTATATPTIPIAAPVPAATPAAVPPPTPTPALRALAERTSKPLEGAAATASPSAAPGDARPVTGAAIALTLATTPDQPAKATEAAPTAIPDATVEADESLAEMARPAEGAAVETHSGAAVRDLSLSTLSRTTIDATAQIAAQILRKLEGRSTRFEMALTPDDLGRVDVRLDIDAEGRLAARLAFDNPAAATDLRGRADELRRQLEDAGFHLADDAFEFAERDSGSSAFDRGQDDRGGHKRAFAAAARLNAEIDVAQPPRWMMLSLSPPGVDMKV